MAVRFKINNLNSFFSFLLLGIIALGVCITVWSLNKGFDLTDESWAYSLIKSGRDTINEPWGFHLLLNPEALLFLSINSSPRPLASKELTILIPLIPIN